jgi:hypothetical protein
VPIRLGDKTWFNKMTVLFKIALPNLNSFWKKQPIAWSLLLKRYLLAINNQIFYHWRQRFKKLVSYKIMEKLFLINKTRHFMLTLEYLSCRACENRFVPVYIDVRWHKKLARPSTRLSCWTRPRPEKRQKSILMFDHIYGKW